MAPGSIRLFALGAALLLALAACGRDASPGNPSPSASAPEGGGDRDCSGDAISVSDAGLREDFPELATAVLVTTDEEGPTTVVEGYVEAGLEPTYDAYHEALEGAGYGILFDEIEEDDAEISWRDPDGDSTGQVALRSECMQGGRTYLRITSRPG
jgi:ABC-type Fe3+-hydroxamate transport system substrate-binding protein